MFIEKVLNDSLYKEKISIVFFDGDTSEFICLLKYIGGDETPYHFQINLYMDGNDVFINTIQGGFRQKSGKYFRNFLNSLISYYKSFDVGLHFKIKHKRKFKEDFLDFVFLKNK